MSVVAAPQKEKTYARLLERIKYMSPGMPLPSVRELMAELSVGQATLVSAYDDLEDRGFIERRPRKGVFVANSTLSSVGFKSQNVHSSIDSRSIDELVSREEVKTILNSGSDGKTSLNLTNVALVLPEFFLDGAGQHPVVSITLSGFNRALNHQKYSISTLFYRPSHLWEDCGKLAMERDIRGLLLWPDSTVSMDDMRQLLDAGIEIVLTQNEKRFVELGLISVNIDTSMALAQILDRFYRLGHRKIVASLYVNNPMRQHYMEVINTFCQRTGISIHEVLVDIPNDPGTTVDYSVLENMLDGEDYPTAIVLADECSAGAMFRLCYERDIRVPEHISIAALINNTPHTYPVPLTSPDSVALGMEEARLGATYLEKLLAGETPSVREVHLRCDVEWKVSTGPVQNKS